MAVLSFLEKVDEPQSISEIKQQIGTDFSG